MLPPSPNDTLAFRRFIVGAVGALVAIVIGIQIPDQPYLLVAGLAGCVYLFTLGVNYRWLASGVIIAHSAAVIVPFLPGRPFLWEALALVSWPSLLAAFLIDRHRLQKLKFDDMEGYVLASLAGYVVVLVILMLVRGVGFRVLGGGQMGGRFYVQQIVLVIVPLLMITAAPSRRALVKAVLVSYALSVTYLISDFALLAGGDRFYFLLQFFELPTDALNFYVGYEITGVRRIQSLWFVGSSVVGAVCVWMSLRDAIGRRLWVGFPLLAGGFVLGLLSGHRIALAHTAFSLVLLGYFQRFWTPLRVLTGGLAASLALVALYLGASTLPDPVQRAVSFLPGIRISDSASDAAWSTLRDRVELFKMALRDMPDYWVIGRGFGMDRADEAADFNYADNLTNQYVRGLFHNGFVGTLLKTGVPGLIFTLLFFGFVSRSAAECIASVRKKPMEAWDGFERLALFLCAQWFSLILFMYCLHGDAGVWVPTFVFPAALVLLCRRELKHSSSEAVPAS